MLRSAAPERKPADAPQAARGRACNERGDPVRLTGPNIDITDRKRGELAPGRANELLRREVEAEVKAREATQARLFQTQNLGALGQLTGGVARDFNNLLSVIISGGALLRNAQDPAGRLRLLDAMNQAAHRGADLTRRLLTFARRQALRPEPLDLRAWLGEVRELLARSLRGDIAIETAAPEELWPVLADRGELELAVNARDAMPRGGTLHLAAGNAEPNRLTDPDGLEGSFVSLSVRDSGTGMPPRCWRGPSSPSSPPRRRVGAPASACRRPTASRGRAAARRGCRARQARARR